MAASKREFGECWNERLVIQILPPHSTFRSRNFLSEPVELPLLPRHKSLPCMLVEKPATRIKILLIAFWQRHFLAARDSLRVGDHFVSRRLRPSRSLIICARGWRGRFPCRRLSRLRSATGAKRLSVLQVGAAARLSANALIDAPEWSSSDRSFHSTV